MPPQVQTARHDATELLGELHPFMAQLGSADGWVTLSAASASLQVPRVDSRPALRTFLEAYRAKILLRIELPAIGQARHHAARRELRELVALDQSLAGQRALEPFAAASRRVGRSQLEKLRPLRDERVVQRYLQAVEDGRAHAWHTLVFGLTLALYSLPVRQGLLTYARQTLGGFIRAAARPLGLTQAECLELLDALGADLPRELETIVAATSCSRIEDQAVSMQSEPRMDTNAHEFPRDSV
jgi:urease accessory protein UreF